jgi:hypothetical protein
MNPSERLRQAALEVAELRRLESVDDAVRARREALRAWQAQRLARTYADLLASARHRAAARFFLDELYCAKDFSQRDTELARLVPMLSRFLPRGALETIADAVELDALTERLDLATAVALEADPLSRGRPIDDDGYARAYRSAGSRVDRERQIALVGQIGRSLDGLVRHPLIGRLLGAMDGPARLAGLTAIHEFLASGFAAFRSMRGADAFLAQIRQRETAAMQRLYAGDPDPFGRAGDAPASTAGPDSG